MKTKLNALGFLPLACVLLMVFAFAACRGTYYNPNLGSGGSSSSDSDNSSDDNSSGGKPAKLADSATAQDALNKLDEIISYSGVSSATKASAQSLKTQISTQRDSNPGNYDSLIWPSVGGTLISSINALIDAL
jgi:hypothetical protein